MDNLAFKHGGNIYEMEKKFKRGFLDFSANINPLGLPSGLKKLLYKNFQRVFNYPDINTENITCKIAQYWRIKKGNILVGNGSVELIYLIISAFSPKTALIPSPSFCEYERAARNINARIKFIKLQEEENFKLNPSGLRASDIVFLCNPNNPTGNLILPDGRIIEKFSNKLTVIDEAFMDFLPDEKRHTLIRRTQTDKRIIVLRTFTKFFALPGLRIGYLVAHRDIIARLREYRIPWSVNFFAQLAAELVLGDREYINDTRQLIEKERRFLINALLGTKNLTPFPSVTNFLLIKINNKNLTSSMLSKRLLRKGILIRDCANFRGLSNKFIRIAVRSHGENVRLIKALEKIT
jgi:threonine-phosphate decarboxylase